MGQRKFIFTRVLLLFANKWCHITLQLYSHNHNDINHSSNTYTNKYKAHIQMVSVVSDTNSLLIRGFGPWQHEERDTILKRLCKPYYADSIPRAAHLVMFKILVGRGPKNPTPSFNGQNPTLSSMVQSQMTSFFQTLKFSGPSLLGMTSSTLQPHFQYGGLL